ncbi:MAG: hypothetical protein ABMA64_26370 [Myxococcota bacterium]
MIGALWVAACTAERDTDGDGLLDAAESELGLDPEASDTDRDGLTDGDEVAGDTDPARPDTDGDGLLDGAEAGYGADPTVVDTDDDGYTDRDEVHEGHDPADPDDRIYQGGWPYLFDKSAIPDDAGDFREVGRTFFRLKLVDVHGDTVDLYDFANDDAPIVLDVSAEWCPPCNGLSSWLSGGEDTYGYATVWGRGPRAVKKGQVRWITVIPEALDNGPADADTIARWSEAYPSDDIPVLVDPTYLSVDYGGLGWWPSLVLLEPDLTVSDANAEGTRFGDQVTVLEELARRFP